MILSTKGCQFTNILNKLWLFILLHQSIQMLEINHVGLCFSFYRCMLTLHKEGYISLHNLIIIRNSHAVIPYLYDEFNIGLLQDQVFSMKCRKFSICRVCLNKTQKLKVCRIKQLKMFCHYGLFVPFCLYYLLEASYFYILFSLLLWHNIGIPHLLQLFQ